MKQGAMVGKGRHVDGCRLRDKGREGRRGGRETDHLDPCGLVTQ